MPARAPGAAARHDGGEWASVPRAGRTYRTMSTSARVLYSERYKRARAASDLLECTRCWRFYLGRYTSVIAAIAPRPIAS